MVLGFSLALKSICYTGRYGNGMSRELALRRPRCRVKRVVDTVLRETDDTRVFIVSGLHTDYAENMMWVKQISTTSYLEDILLVAGDVAETYDKFCLTMSLLKKRFKHVLYVPGNHDLWCRSKSEDFLDSLDKLNALLDACGELGVESTPMKFLDLGIIPLFSWYHESFDKEQDITGLHVPPLELYSFKFIDLIEDLTMFCVLYVKTSMCANGLLSSVTEDSLALYFDAMNDKQADVIDEIKRQCINYPNLPKIIGSDFLEVRIRSIHGAEGSERACHLFGHTHFGWDAILDGIRFGCLTKVYTSLSKRTEKKNEWGFTERGHFAWSDHYSINPRSPDIQQLAPWVAKLYRR
ncbi:hypothetical protein Cgig2_019836 [Carnegiea gigantea]|uniref:Calcineurin-like phosphoesterase domain-containing protein n=1 Tax=Carnegiea gigantea TaxID=171969 RepID=A0A9Q1GHT8_9CARY|nr:hypothetical protein Cgig2_019836 [Carnegiea gigantea]